MLIVAHTTISIIDRLDMNLYTYTNSILYISILYAHNIVRSLDKNGYIR